ncbi:MAG: amidohydrolase family protein [Planctomycetota bacterium]|nr:amidohydrolase family protein [Planctomycetota bacterium]
MLRSHSILFGALGALTALAGESLAASTSLAGGPLAIRVGRAETVAKGVIEHAVILVEDGKIVTIGEDLPVERGITVIDRPNWTVMPGLVSSYTRIGMDSEGGDDMSPDVKASTEIFPKSRDLRKVVEYGVTTLGIYPAGNGIPGLAAAIRPRGDTVEEMVLKDPAYLKIVMRSDSASKKRVRDAFAKADEYDEKVKKAREKWDKDKDSKKGKKEEKKEEKPEEKKPGMAGVEGQGPGPDAAEEPKADAKAEKAADGFVPPIPDDKVRAFVEMRAKKLRALVTLTSAADWLHWLDAIGKETIGFDVRLVLNQESDYFYVLDKKTYDLEADGIGDRKIHAVVEPLLTYTPNTRRVRNLPMELAKAGAKVCFTPRFDDLVNYKAWLGHVAELVGAGMTRDVALRALTLNPAEMLGVADRVGSLEKGKDANFVFLDGDPFQPATRIQAVMLDGRFVFGEVDP